MPVQISKSKNLSQLAPNESRLLIIDKLNSFDIHLAKNSKLTLVLILTKGSTDKKFLTFNMDGSGSRLNFYIINIGKSSESFDFNTKVIHSGQNTHSQIKIRSLLSDNSRLSTIGTIIIQQGATKTVSHLRHDTLLLSSKSSVHTIPCLEILEDDVKAGHGATIGNLNEEHLYYLQTRGLDETEAKSLLVNAFFDSIINELENEETREYIKSKLQNLL